MHQSLYVGLLDASGSFACSIRAYHATGNHQVIFCDFIFTFKSALLIKKSSENPQESSKIIILKIYYFILVCSSINKPRIWSQCSFCM